MNNHLFRSFSTFRSDYYPSLVKKFWRSSGVVLLLSQSDCGPEASSRGREVDVVKFKVNPYGK